MIYCCVYNFSLLNLFLYIHFRWLCNSERSVCWNIVCKKCKGEYGCVVLIGITFIVFISWKCQVNWGGFKSLANFEPAMFYWYSYIYVVSNLHHHSHTFVKNAVCVYKMELCMRGRTGMVLCGRVECNRIYIYLYIAYQYICFGVNINVVMYKLFYLSVSGNKNRWLSIQIRAQIADKYI